LLGHGELKGNIMNLSNPFQTIRREDRRDVQRALAMIPDKTLQEMEKDTKEIITVCAWCKKGEADSHGKKVSHGICKMHYEIMIKEVENCGP
jgi:hypothetical protein